MVEEQLLVKLVSKLPLSLVGFSIQREKDGSKVNECRLSRVLLSVENITLVYYESVVMSTSS